MVIFIRLILHPLQVFRKLFVGLIIRYIQFMQLIQVQ